MPDWALRGPARRAAPATRARARAHHLAQGGEASAFTRTGTLSAIHKAIEQIDCIGLRGDGAIS